MTPRCVFLPCDKQERERLEQGGWTLSRDETGRRQGAVCTPQPVLEEAAKQAGCQEPRAGYPFLLRWHVIAEGLGAGSAGVSRGSAGFSRRTFASEEAVRTEDYHFSVPPLQPGEAAPSCPPHGPEPIREMLDCQEGKDPQGPPHSQHAGPQDLRWKTLETWQSLQASEEGYTRLCGFASCPPIPRTTYFCV